MPWPEPRDYDHQNMLYPDRKMLKWQGMLLSDHRDVMNNEALALSLVRDTVDLDEQTLEEFDMLCKMAFLSHSIVKMIVDQPKKPLIQVTGKIIALMPDSISLDTGAYVQTFKVRQIISLQTSSGID
ncbi:MAG: hypothetical protein VB108_10110 [Anaerolineaceae bacterium]|nr:hypothetical protein [Anaerolineaceae bacterium]